MNIGSLIREHRQNKGFTQNELAEITGFSKSYIQKFEENKRDVSSSQLIKLATALNFSISEVLSNSSFKIKDFELMNIEFREKHKSDNVDDLKSEILNNIHYKFSAYVTLEEVLDVKKTFKNPIKTQKLISNYKEIEDLSKFLRKKWKFNSLPIYSLLNFLEDLGIKIFEVDRDEDFIGLSCWIKKTPVIVFNIRNKNVSRRRFTVLHELGHLLMSFDNRLKEKMVERFCDQFAGAMLLPKEVLEEYLSFDNITLNELNRIKSKFGISIQAILIRLVNIKYIDWEKYHEWMELYKSWDNNKVSFQVPESVNRFDYLLYRAVREKKITYIKACELVQIPVSELRANINKIFIK